MVPNHLFQLLTMIATEPPTSFDPDAVRSRKADILNAIPAVGLDCAVRGQYGKGEIDGHPVVDYRQEPDVSPTSPIETYVALKLEIDSWRWAGVPFYMRTGKSMSKRWTEIAIQFRRAPLSVFHGTDVSHMAPNWLVLQIQPDEGISFQFQVKRPGQTVALAPVKSSFAYKDWFPPSANVGYETLIYDCMIGDATLFQRADMVEAGWRIVQPVLDGWAAEKPTDFPNYAGRQRWPQSRRGTAGQRRRSRLAADRRSFVRRRRMPRISLLLADVDGTLVTEQKVLTERARAAVAKLHDRGIRFAVTSGRPPRGMAMLIEPLALSTPLAGFNGGVFTNPDLSVIETRSLAPEVARQAIDIIQHHGMDAWLYTGTDWQVHKKDAPHVAREGWTVKFEPTSSNATRCRSRSGGEDRRRQRRPCAGRQMRGGRSAGPGQQRVREALAALLSRRHPSGSEQGRRGGHARPSVSAFPPRRSRRSAICRTTS
jgi:hypothetical protein